ncbi:MAG: D-2-hydroxyacid dehydrogenase [Proteobacteria bacterium]|nr:D-2-hydroxyacid dehydrogenase [Pseudomonadota bacterium]
MEIFAFIDLNDKQIARVREIAGSDRLHLHGWFAEGDVIEPAFPNSEVVFGNVPPSWLPQASSTAWIQLESIGFGEYLNLDWQLLGERITMTNLAGFFTEPVAETALAGILSLYRGLDRLVLLKEKKQWVGDPLREQLRTLQGANVVLFGYGAINLRLTELLDPYQCHIAHFDIGWTPAKLDEALATADVVVCSVPEAKGTVGVFNKKRLELLKNDALFINVGRGSVVDEDALATALHNHRIGGAVVDVTMKEPIPETHPLWDAPNTILTQHSGGGTSDEIDRKIDVFAANLARYRSGEPLMGIVDFERGF